MNIDDPKNEDGFFVDLVKSIAKAFASTLGRIAAVAVTGALIGAVVGYFAMGGLSGARNGAILGGAAGLGLAVLISSV